MRAAHWAALCEEQEELTCVRACVECEHLLGSSGSTSRFSCMHTDATQSHTHNFLLAPSIGRLNEPPTDTLTNCTQTHTTIHIYSSYHSVAQRAAYIYIYICGSMSRQRIRSRTVHKHTQLYTYIAHTIQWPNEPPIYIYIYMRLNEPPTDTLTNCTQTHTTIHIYSSYHSAAERAANIYIYMFFVYCIASGSSVSRQRDNRHNFFDFYITCANTTNQPFHLTFARMQNPQGGRIASSCSAYVILLGCRLKMVRGSSPLAVSTLDPAGWCATFSVAAFGTPVRHQLQPPGLARNWALVANLRLRRRCLREWNCFSCFCYRNVTHCIH